MFKDKIGDMTMSRITINKGSFEIGQRQINNGTITIGRSKSNDVALDDTTVSGCHAKIVTVMNTSYVQDLDSTNGTYVNGEKVKQRVLKPNDIVGIGKHEILFLSQQNTQTSDSEDSIDRTQLLSVDTNMMQSSAAKAKMLKRENKVPVARAANSAEAFPAQEHSVQSSSIRVVVDNTSRPRNVKAMETASRVTKPQLEKVKQQQLNTPPADENKAKQTEARITHRQLRTEQPKVAKTTSRSVTGTSGESHRKVISDFESVHFDNNYRNNMGRYMKTQRVSPNQMVKQIIMTEKQMGGLSKTRTMYVLLGLAALALVNVVILSFF